MKRYKKHMMQVLKILKVRLSTVKHSWRHGTARRSLLISAHNSDFTGRIGGALGLLLLVFQPPGFLRTCLFNIMNSQEDPFPHFPHFPHSNSNEMSHKIGPSPSSPHISPTLTLHCGTGLRLSPLGHVTRTRQSERHDGHNGVPGGRGIWEMRLPQLH